MDNSRLKFARMKGVASTAAQEKALGIEQTEELPALSAAEVLDVKRRTVRRGDSP